MCSLPLWRMQQGQNLTTFKVFSDFSKALSYPMVRCSGSCQSPNFMTGPAIAIAAQHWSPHLDTSHQFQKDMTWSTKILLWYKDIIVIQRQRQMQRQSQSFATEHRSQHLAIRHQFQKDVTWPTKRQWQFDCDTKTLLLCKDKDKDIAKTFTIDCRALISASGRQASVSRRPDQNN